MMQEEQIEFFKIEIAGIKIEVECKYHIVLNFCHKYLASFEKPDFVVRASSEDLIAGRLPDAEKMNHFTGVAFRFADEYIESSVICQKITEEMISFNTLLMHGSVVAKDGYAYMFTAPSGVGKTTRTKIFRNLYPDSIIVNGDKPFIKVTSTEVVACGTPWCGKEGWNTNIMVPLRAIFLLERVKDGEESSVEEISLGKAFPFLLQQTYRSKKPELMRKTLQLLKLFDGKLKIYKYRSSPTEESVRLAYEAARPNDEESIGGVYDSGNDSEQHLAI